MLRVLKKINTAPSQSRRGDFDTEGARHIESPPGKEPKISPVEAAAKDTLRRLRRNRGLNMNQGAELLGLTRKQLEDLETKRDYGSHVQWKLIHTACSVYGVSPEEFMPRKPLVFGGSSKSN